MHTSTIQAAVAAVALLGLVTVLYGAFRPGNREQLLAEESKLVPFDEAAVGELHDGVPSPLYNITILDARQRPIHLEQALKGKAAIILNVAMVDSRSEKEINALNQLYRKYRAKGLEIIAFPTNEFGDVLPQADEDVHRHFRGALKAKFIIAATTAVNGEQAHPVFRILKHQIPGAIQGNYAGKFLINQQGWAVRRTKGSALHLENEIQDLLSLSHHMRDEL